MALVQLLSRLRQNDVTLERLFLGGHDCPRRFGKEPQVHLLPASPNVRSLVALGAALAANTAVSSLVLHGIDDESEDWVVAVAEGLANNSGIRSLELRGGRLRGERGAVVVAEAVRTTRVLQQLSMAGGFIGNESCLALAETLKSSTTLQSLSLEYCHFSAPAIAELAEALKVNKWLRSLMVSGEWGGITSVPIVDSLRTNTTLEQLHVRTFAKFDKCMVLALANLLKVNTTLRTLGISDTIVLYRHDQDAVASFAQALQTNTTLRCLAIEIQLIGIFDYMVDDRYDTDEDDEESDGGHTGDDSDVVPSTNGGDDNNGWAAVLAPLEQAFRSNTGLESLSLNCPYDELCMLLTTALRENLTLRSVTLEGWTERSAALLAKVLQVNRTIESVSLACQSPINRTTSGMFAEVIKVNTTLRQLVLRSGFDPDSQEWGADVGVALSEALQLNTTLRILELDGGYGGEVCAQLAGSLKRDVTLHSLALRGYQGSEINRLVAGSLKTSTWLHTLVLDGEWTDDLDVAAMVDALEVNTTLQWLEWDGGVDLSDREEGLLRRNRELVDFWYLLTWLCRRSGLTGVREVVAAMSERGFQRAVFGFLLPCGSPRRRSRGSCS